MGHGVRIALARLASLSVAALGAVLAASTPAAAAPTRITGTLSQPGYTVIALAADGRATSVRVRGRTFGLRPPAKRVTLHLRASTGSYAGPVVIGREKKGRVAIVGVKAGAKLGRIKIGRGYARLAKRLGKKLGRRQACRPGQAGRPDRRRALRAGALNATAPAAPGR